MNVSSAHVLTPTITMKLKQIILFTAVAGVAVAGPGRPGFASAPEWLDTNENGQIDPEEVQAWAELRKEAAKGLVDRADANGDGDVDPEERENAIANIRAKIIEKRCELFDSVNGEDDLLTLDEFSAIGPVSNLPEEIAELLFGLLDADGDGSVTKDEFLGAVGGEITIPSLPERPEIPNPPRP